MGSPEKTESAKERTSLADGIRSIRARTTEKLDAVAEDMRGLANSGPQISERVERGLDRLEDQVSRAVSDVQKLPERLDARARALRDSADPVASAVGKAFAHDSPEVVPLDADTTEALIDLYNQFGAPLLGAIDSGDGEAIARVLVPALAQAEGRMHTLALAFAAGAMEGGLETWAWFQGGAHDAELRGFLERLQHVDWTRAESDFKAGVRVGLLAPWVQILALVDDIDVIMKGLEVLAVRVAVSPAGPTAAREVGRLIAASPSRSLSSLYATEAAVIPYELGRLLGAPILSFAIGFACALVAPKAAIGALATRISKAGGSFLADALRAGRRVGLAFHRDQSGTLDLAAPLHWINKAATWWTRHGWRKPIDFDGWRFRFELPPGKRFPGPRKSPRFRRLEGLSHVPPEGQPRWGWSNRVAGTGGIHGIRGRFDGSRVGITIYGEICESLKRSKEAPNFNQSYQPQPGVLRDHWGVHDMQILHLWGPGFGDEAEAGLMYGPRVLNNLFQNVGIEKALRTLRKEANEQGYRLLCRADARSHPFERTKKLVGVGRTDGPEDPLLIPETSKVKYTDGSSTKVNRRIGGLFVEEVSYRFSIVDSDGRTAGPDFEINLHCPHPKPGSPPDVLPPVPTVSVVSYSGDLGPVAERLAEAFREVLGR